MRARGAPVSSMTVGENRIGEIDRRDRLAFVEIVLTVLPLRRVPAPGQPVEAAQQIAGVQVIGIDPRLQFHALIFGPEHRHHASDYGCGFSYNHQHPVKRFYSAVCACSAFICSALTTAAAC